MNPSYKLVMPARGMAYIGVISLAARFSSYAGVAVSSLPLERRSPSFRSFLSDAEPYLVLQQVGLRHIPGVRYVSRSDGARNLYHLNDAMVRLLICSANQLNDWWEPMLPDDLHLLRRDGSPVLIDTASEGRHYLTLTERERQVWLSAWPDSLTEVSERPDEE